MKCVTNHRFASVDERNTPGTSEGDGAKDSSNRGRGLPQPQSMRDVIRHFHYVFKFVDVVVGEISRFVHFDPVV